MNRRDLFKRLAAAGLVLAAPEAVRRYWQLDQTMVPSFQRLVAIGDWTTETGRFDASRMSFDKIIVGASTWPDRTYGTIIINGKRYPLV